MKIEVCIWEHDEYIIAIRPDDAPASTDKPIGYTLSRPDAVKIREWLETALPEIQQATQAELAAVRAERDAARKALADVEWVEVGDYGPWCPSCRGLELSGGHRMGCQLAAALQVRAERDALQQQFEAGIADIRADLAAARAEFDAIRQERDAALKAARGLTQERDAAVGALQAVEWDEDGVCPACYSFKHVGHLTSCTTAAALALVRGE